MLFKVLEKFWKSPSISYQTCMNHVLANTWCDVGWRSEHVAVVAVFASNFYMPAKRKTRSPRQTGVSISPADKK